MYPNTPEAMSDYLRANVVLSGQKVKIFLLRWETRQEHPLLQFLFNLVLEVLAQVIRQEKETKTTQVGKEEVKLSVGQWQDLIERNVLGCHPPCLPGKSVPFPGWHSVLECVTDSWKLVSCGLHHTISSFSIDYGSPLMDSSFPSTEPWMQMYPNSGLNSLFLPCILSQCNLMHCHDFKSSICPKFSWIYPYQPQGWN
jgi:hypothetical protein